MWSSMYCGSEAMPWQALRVGNDTNTTGSHRMCQGVLGVVFSCEEL